MSQLPKGWYVTEIKNILAPQKDGKLIHQGWSPRCHVESAGQDEWGVLKTTAIQDGYFLEEHNKKLPIDKEPKERIEVKPGDLLMTNAGPRKRCGVTTFVQDVRSKLMLSGKMYRMRFDESKVYPKYVELFLRTQDAQKEIDQRKTGMSESGLNLTQQRFLSVPVVMCSFEEQKRIADKLDSVLAKVEAAQARLDKIPAILKRFRQSVLAAATSGELTKEWRGDEKYRDETLNWPITKIPESWDLKFLEEVAESRLGKMLDKSKNFGIATKYLGNINLRWHHIDLSELKEILVSQKEIDELNIRDGDLLLCEGGEPGRGAVWKGGDNNLVFQKAIHRVRCTDCISPEFLLYSIENDFFSNRLNLLYTGTTIKHLTGKALKKYPVRIPPITEQKEIVRRVNRLLEASSKIEEQYLAAKLRVNQLTQSILKKAFEGELLTSEVENEFLQELSDVEAVEC